MELTIKRPTNVKASNRKTIQFLNSDGVKKVFDVHRYSENGTLLFKRKNQMVAV